MDKLQEKVLAPERLAPPTPSPLSPDNRNDPYSTQKLRLPTGHEDDIERARPSYSSSQRNIDLATSSNHGSGTQRPTELLRPSIETSHSPRRISSELYAELPGQEIRLAHEQYVEMPGHLPRSSQIRASSPPPPKYDREYDHQKPWTKFPSGYPRLAAFMAYDEDRSTTIFRRFQRLSTRNLLYLESELVELEAEQDRLDQASRIDDDLKMSMRSWDLLCLQATPPADDEKLRETAEEEQRRVRLEEAAQERLRLAWRIREVLKNYHDALKRESEVLSLSAPDRRPLKGTRKIFLPTYDSKKGLGTGAAMLHGPMKSHLDAENEKDLCVLAPPVERDRLTRLLEGRLSYFFRTRTEDGLSDFVSHNRISVAVSVISGLLATIFLIGAILGLYWVTNPNVKLGMLSGLTVGFAGSLALFTNARRQDVFASTAAYAAVLVVFVSGTLSTSAPAPSVSSPSGSHTSISIFTSTVLKTLVATATQTHTTRSTFFTSAASPTATSNTNTSSKRLSAAKIAGIVLGVVGVVVALLIVLGTFILKKKSKPRSSSGFVPALPTMQARPQETVEDMVGSKRPETPSAYSPATQQELSNPSTAPRSATHRTNFGIEEA